MLDKLDDRVIEAWEVFKKAQQHFDEIEKSLNVEKSREDSKIGPTNLNSITAGSEMKELQYAINYNNIDIESSKNIIKFYKANIDFFNVVKDIYGEDAEIGYDFDDKYVSVCGVKLYF